MDNVTSRYVSRLSPVSVKHSCGHSILRLLRNTNITSADCPCGVCSGEMTQEQMDKFQESARRHG